MLHSLTDHGEAIAHGKQRRFAGVLQHRHDHLIKQLTASFNHIQMPQRYRVKTAWINRQHTGSPKLYLADYRSKGGSADRFTPIMVQTGHAHRPYAAMVAARNFGNALVGKVWLEWGQLAQEANMIQRDVLTQMYGANGALVAQALAAIAQFEAFPAPSTWPYLDKATILAEMRSRVQDPFQVNQGGQPFCGPAAVLFELVRKQPLRYVQICWSLYTTGSFQGHLHFIKASDALRQASRGDLKMGQIDWMFLATLRDMEEKLFPVEPNAPDLIRNLAGMTKSWELKGWVQELLGYKFVKYNHAYLMNDVSAMNQAAAAIQAGGVAFALITAEGMLGNKPPLLPFPSHWIALLGNIAVQGDPVTFDIYTWSKALRLQMDASSFKKYLWATVSATP